MRTGGVTKGQGCDDGEERLLTAMPTARRENLANYAQRSFGRKPETRREKRHGVVGEKRLTALALT